MILRTALLALIASSSWSTQVYKYNLIAPSETACAGSITQAYTSSENRTIFSVQFNRHNNFGSPCSSTTLVDNVVINTGTPKLVIAADPGEWNWCIQPRSNVGNSLCSGLPDGNNYIRARIIGRTPGGLKSVTGNCMLIDCDSGIMLGIFPESSGTINLN